MCFGSLHRSLLPARWSTARFIPALATALLEEDGIILVAGVYEVDNGVVVGLLVRLDRVATIHIATNVMKVLRRSGIVGFTFTLFLDVPRAQLRRRVLKEANEQRNKDIHEDALDVKVDICSGRLNEVAAVLSVQLVVSAYAAVTTVT